MRANRRSMAPAETMRDATWLLIIEKEKSWPHCPSIIATNFYHLKPSWRRPSQPEEEGRPRRDRTDFFRDPENGVTLKQFVHSISMVLATMVAKSVMVVMLRTAMTYLETCQFTETWRMHLQELPPIPFVLFLLRISVFSASICMFDFSYFSAISFIDF